MASASIREDDLRGAFLQRIMGLLVSQYGDLNSSHCETLVDTIVWLLQWSRNRGIYSATNCGFLTDHMLTVMVCIIFMRSLGTHRTLNKRQLIKSFFSIFASWKFNESSVAGDCCGIARLQNDPCEAAGSIIDEFAKLDSDDEELEQVHSSTVWAPVDTPQPHHKDLATSADDNDEVHAHKRHRYELGQIRDVRRFHEVENQRFERVSLIPGGEQYPSNLDFLDAFSVMDPLDPEVNLAIRVLESHKKLILQELVRADQLLCDSVGDDDSVLFGPDSDILRPADRFDCSAYIVFAISSEFEDVRAYISNIVEEQTWFFMQEIQAFHGVMVTPFSDCVSKNKTTQQVVVGISFVQDEPYWATENVNLDFSGPMSRALLRARKALNKREDFESRFSKKFTVTAKLLSQQEFLK
jgi:hypothetical protein